MLTQRVRAIVEHAGGTMAERGAYPGWQYNRDSCPFSFRHPAINAPISV